MFTTTNMGLTAWDQGNDPYEPADLADNWVAVDNHDHTSGKGRQIPTAGIQDGAVTPAKLGDGSITTAKLADHSVTRIKLAADAVGSSEIADRSVGTSELADGSVTAAKLDPSLYIIGEVIDWYRPNTSVPIPTGNLEVCDGRPWSAIPNAWGVTTGNIPDLRNKFILGAGTTNIGSGTGQNPDIGQSGGGHTTSLAHTHGFTIPGLTIPSHVHSIGSDGTHTHTTDSQGAHTHSIATGGLHHHGFVGTYFVVGHGRFNTGASISFNDTTGQPHATSYHAVVPTGLTGDPPDDTSIDMADDGSHNHGGATGSAGAHTHTTDGQGAHSHGGSTGSSGGTTGGTTGSTDSQLSTLDKRPGYVGLLKLMRVL